MANKTTKEKPEMEIEGDVDMQTKFDAYIGDEPYLFVSYSHRDTAKVYPILDALYDRKYRIWYDESCETGNDFRDELRQRIEGAEAVLLFVRMYCIGALLSPPYHKYGGRRDIHFFSFGIQDFVG